MRLLLLFASVLASWSSVAATWEIRYPKPELDTDLRTTYPLQVLSLALEQTGVRYNLLPTQKVIGQGKSIKQLKANREVSVIWSMTDKIREEELLPVRIPIYKGLIGYRIFFVKSEHRSLFSSFSDISELRQYSPVQGYDWPDTKILQHNGFEVVTSNDFNAMYNILDVERANFFPRSVVEIWAELDRDNHSEYLAIEPHIALRYPTATYFFFNKKNLVLANLIETGLRRAIESGEFDKLFMQVHEGYLTRANINQRLIFELDNPVLPEATPVDDAKLWYTVN